MGWEVIAFVNIELTCLVTKKLVKDVKKILEETGTSFYRFQEFKDSIEFELSGNKGVDYECLDKIKEKFKQYIIQISAGEFVEAEGGGYYYNTQDEEILI